MPGFKRPITPYCRSLARAFFSWSGGAGGPRTRIDIGLSFHERDAGLQAANPSLLQITGADLLLLVRERERHPQLRSSGEGSSVVGKLETRRHYPDHFERPVVELDNFSYDLVVRTEVTLPKSIADNSHAV